MARVSNTNHKIGAALRQARLYRGLNQAELAFLLGAKSSSVVSVIETATATRDGVKHERSSGMGVATLHRFAKALNINLTLTTDGEWAWSPAELDETDST